MNVHQISILYDALQDRILWRVNFTDDAGEQSAWLTRRLCLGLWPRLNEVVTDHVSQLQALHGTAASSVALASADTRQMLSDLKREEVRQKADFSKPFAVTSANDDPLLVHTVQMQPLPKQKRLKISLQEKPDDQRQARQWAIELDEKTLHACMSMLDAALGRSGWDLPDPTAPATTAPVKSDTDSNPLDNLERPKYLN